MMWFVNIPGNADPILIFSATGAGAGTTTFAHDQGVEANYPGELYPAVFIFAITDIVGTFTGLQVNLEWSPITPDVGAAQFQTVGTWTPLTTPVAYFPCSASGIYRLNCTSFVGGTSFNVYTSISSTMPQGNGGATGVVTQGTSPWVVAFSTAQHVIIDSGGGGGVQFADNAASGATPTGTLSMGWDSVNSKIRALKVDASQNLLVDVSNASIAVTGTFFQATQPVSIAATVNVQGTKTPADSYANPTDAVDTFALLAGWDATNSKWQRAQVDAATGTLKVDPGTVTVTGTVSVTNFANPLPVSQSGLWNVNQAIGVAGFGKITDGSNTAAVKAASTAAGAADPSLVVALSPNSPLPAGTNVIGHVVVDSGAITVSGTVTSNQGTAATLAGAWPVEVTDGTNILGTVAHPLVTSSSGAGGGTSAIDESVFTLGTSSETPAGGVNIGGSNVQTVLFGQTGTLQMTGDRKLVVTDPGFAGINDLLGTLILEVRAMRRAIVHMVTESGQFLDSDFDPANLDFQPIN
jgi:hypothetical protein